MVHHRRSILAALTVASSLAWLTGCAGDAGPAGAAGGAGPSGPSGPAGASGPAGGIGPSGPSGPPGVLGPSGPSGPSGPTGENGATGPSGPTGPTGETGASGPSGPAGATGPTGPAGQNAWVVGPGLQVALSEVTVAADGLTSLTVTVSDGAGVPLDRTGLLTVGSVDLAFVYAALDPSGVNGGAAAYAPYTNRVDDGPATALQGAVETSGSFAALGQGRYRYTFTAHGDPARVAFTHRVVVSAARTFDGRREVANAAVDFRPDGGALDQRPAVVDEGACAACHGALRAHGGAWRALGTCTPCHTPSMADGDTGERLDFNVMVHKLHRGQDLPSVAAGAPYRFVDDAGAVTDFSTVAFPQAIGRCTACHQGATSFATAVSRAACGACHDLTAFEGVAGPGQVAHTGGTQLDDANCTVCHRPGGLSPVAERHRPAADALAPVEATILSVTNALPGQQPVVTFAVTVGGQPRDLQASPLTRLVLSFAGPTTDYASTWTSTIQTGTPGAITPTGTPGTYVYTVPAAASIPVIATGSYAAALEGYLQPTLTDPRVGLANTPFFFAVTDATPVARRAPVTTAACAACHHRLGAHGGIRTTVEYCAFCHNPQKANDQRVSRLEGSTVVARSVDLKVMIHAIHRGAAHAEPYVLGGNPTPSAANPAGTQIDFTGLRFPGDLARCTTCHQPGSYSLPLAAGVQPSTSLLMQCAEDPALDPDLYCTSPFWTVAATTRTPPVTAACTGCHDAPSTALHAEVMTTAAGQESCLTCHGPATPYDVERVHQPAP
jgi:OmcA/MtrC family decaheme c-type cytochrome